MQRRIFLKGTLAGSALAVAASAGLINPRAVMAAWPKAAFEAKDMPGALNSAVGSDTSTPSDAINIKAPDIAENGAVVPIRVSVDGVSGVESISLLVEGNATPLVAHFRLAAGTQPDVSTRIKMGKTSNVVAVVKANGSLMSARKEVKVTIGGCGG